MSRVYLDYHIRRENFRYVGHRGFDQSSSEDNDRVSEFRLRDIADDWFSKLRKPDFQRETNSWTPEGCFNLIDSLCRQDVIPGIIVWKSSDSGNIYVVDGAHRLSVIRAWMMDDWGDRKIDYYNEHHRDEILQAAREARDLVAGRIGSYEDFKNSYKKMRSVVDEGGAPREKMDLQSFHRARFYSAIVDGRPIQTQWIPGKYEEAERSFLRINRGGEPLSEFERNIIEFRNSPYARVVSSIVSAGSAGRFWPEHGIDSQTAATVRQLPDYATAVHNIMFRPPFDGQVRDTNQPLVVSKPGDRYEDGLELVALIYGNEFLVNDEAKKECLGRWHDVEPVTIIEKAREIFRVVLDRLSQLLGESANPRSLSIVPLVYTYNHQGLYSRNLLYGFIYWLFSGSDEAVKLRKVGFSAIRGAYERFLVEYKDQLTQVVSKKGGSFKSTKDIALAIDKIVGTLLLDAGGGSDNAVLTLIKELGFVSRRSDVYRGRTASRTQRNQINIDILFQGAPRCPICKGVLDFRQGKQYDHYFEKFSVVKSTMTDNLRPTHPFCNNMKDQILMMQSNGNQKLPLFTPDAMTYHMQPRQLTLFDLI